MVGGIRGYMRGVAAGHRISKKELVVLLQNPGDVR